MSDFLWSCLVSCWAPKPADRPTMQFVAWSLGELVAAHHKPQLDSGLTVSAVPKSHVELNSRPAASEFFGIGVI